jgi:hypothetical protein
MIGSPSVVNQTIDPVTQSSAPAAAMTRRIAVWALFAGLWATLPREAAAAELYRNGDLTLRWDNTIKYSAAWRLAERDRTLIVDPNGDDGDRSFAPGLISNRVDLLSELGIVAGRFGAEASAAAWYDTVYNRAVPPDTAQPPGFYPLPTRFAPEVRDLHGRHAELLNAFVSATADVGGGPLTVRIGRQTVLWGESVFFAGNGIAAGQAPIDAIKATGVPASRAQEVFMPVTQVVATWQPRGDLTVAAYYQLEWRDTRVPGAGSYFSAADFLDAGGEKLYVARDQYLTRAADRDPPSAGQFGIALRRSGGAVDWGLYVLRFHARDPQVYLRPLPARPPTGAADVERNAAYGYTPGIVGGAGGQIRLSYPFGVGLPLGPVGSYQLVYPRGIEIYGASISSYLGDSTVAGEVSFRRHMPLVSATLVVLPGTDPAAPLYARGDTAHAQASFSATLASSALWRSADLTAEVAVNQRLGVDLNPAALDPSRNRFAASLRLVFEPRYFAVLPGLDMSLPLSFGHGLVGRSSVDAAQDPQTGDITFGVSLTYRAVWQATLAATKFLGPVQHQPFADRDYVSLSLQRTF